MEERITRRYYDKGDWKFPFILCAPEHLIKGLPLILQLHGAGERGDGGEDLKKLDKYGFNRNLKEFPCLIAVPQCPTGSFWAAEIPNIFLFLEQLKTEFQVDIDRIYLTGLSMGGYGTWLTAARYPDLFAAIAPVCGGGMVWTANLLKMPIWAFHGTEDPIVYPTETLNMIRRVREHAAPEQEVKLTMLDGVGHNAWDYTYDEQLLDWLLSKRKCEKKNNDRCG